MKRVMLLVVVTTVVVACRTAPVPPVPSSQPTATSAATPAAPPQDVMIRTRVAVGDSYVPQRGEAALRDFVPDVAADESGGECSLMRTGGSGATVVTAFYPNRTNARFQINIFFDSAGHVTRYNERRGVLHITGLRTPAQLDSAVHAQEAAMRSTTVSLDYAIDQAIAMNRGDGKPTVAVLGTVRAMENLPALGPVSARMERMRKLCGV